MVWAREGDMEWMEGRYAGVNVWTGSMVRFDRMERRDEGVWTGVGRGPKQGGMDRRAGVD